jgi:hypothetical protein
VDGDEDQKDGHPSSQGRKRRATSKVAGGAKKQKTASSKSADRSIPIH